FFFFQAEDGIRDRTVTGVQTCALPIFSASLVSRPNDQQILECIQPRLAADVVRAAARSARPLAARYRNRRHRPWPCACRALERADRKSTRLNSSHRTISYAVFCLKKKK